MGNNRADMHKNCYVQYLGRDYSLGIAKKAYYCIDHRLAFWIMSPVSKPTEATQERKESNG